MKLVTKGHLCAVRLISQNIHKCIKFLYTYSWLIYNDPYEDQMINLSVHKVACYCNTSVHAICDTKWTKQYQI